MADRRSAFLHLSRGLEELMRAGAETLAVVRERAERGADEPASPLERALRGLADDAGAWLASGESAALQALRAALRRELARWEVRAGEDPAAERVRGLFDALLGVLGESGEETPEALRAAPWRAPSRRTR
jgi:hypothetical protein